jgi:hypothetical protein
VFSRFVFIWEWTATCTTYFKTGYVFITEMKSVLQRGTDWRFKYCSVRLFCKGLIMYGSSYMFRHYIAILMERL